MNISVAIEQAKDIVAIMKLEGAIDASNFMEVVDKAEEIYNNPARNLVIDLSNVTGITSTGQVAIHKIALIYSGVPQDVEEGANPDFTHSHAARKYVKLVNPQPEVDASLEKAGFKLYFKVYADIKSALESI